MKLNFEANKINITFDMKLIRRVCKKERGEGEKAIIRKHISKKEHL